MTTWVVPTLLASSVLLWRSARADLALGAFLVPRNPAASGAVSRGVLGRFGSRWRPSRQAGAAQVLDLVEGIAPALESGLAPSTALMIVARARAGGGLDDEVAALALRMSEVAADGRALGPAWHEAASATRSAELRLLAQAWSLTEDLGAPLADAVRTTSGLLRARIAQERRLAAATAGAQATIHILTLLPLGGPVLAFMLGIGPADLYAGSPLTVLCIGLGVALVVVGRWWVRRMVNAVARGPVIA